MPDENASLAAARRSQLEEEGMTRYSQEDLNGWEFKIVRANTRVFGKRAVFEKLIKEEARAGWVLLEKFDDSRVRFKRPVSAREKDAGLPPGVDPYRTQYGLSPLLFVLLILSGIVVGLCLLMALVYGVLGSLAPIFSGLLG
jgi:hypothetical protein